MVYETSAPATTGTAFAKRRAGCGIVEDVGRAEPDASMAWIDWARSKYGWSTVALGYAFFLPSILLTVQYDLRGRLALRRRLHRTRAGSSEECRFVINRPGHAPVPCVGGLHDQRLTCLDLFDRNQTLFDADLGSLIATRIEPAESGIARMLQGPASAMVTVSFTGADDPVRLTGISDDVALVACMAGWDVSLVD